MADKICFTSWLRLEVSLKIIYSNPLASLSLLQTCPWVSGAWDFWRQILPVKTKVKEQAKISMSSITPSQARLPHSAHIFQSSFYCWCTCRSPLCCTSQPFPDSISDGLQPSKVSMSLYSSCFHILLSFFFFLMYEFSEDVFFHPCRPPATFAW